MGKFVLGALFGSAVTFACIFNKGLTTIANKGTDEEFNEFIENSKFKVFKQILIDRRNAIKQ